jgi:23S rRNA (uracil1939-C5)-methyltransferase
MSAKPLVYETIPARIDALTHDGRGVGRVASKTVFVTGALPGEEVLFRYTKRRSRFDEGIVTEVIIPSVQRVSPACPHFHICGGCTLQHLDWQAQLAGKQRFLLEQLEHVGRVQPEEVLPPITGSPWGYRRRARLGAKYVAKKGRVLVGFREKASAFIAELTGCHTLHPSVGQRLLELRDLISGLDARQHIPQVEVAVGDAATALVFRHLVPMSASDLDQLRTFGEQHGFYMYLQPGGPETVAPLWPENAKLSYCLPEFGVELFFLPTDFVQVNAEVNREMVKRAIALLDPTIGERILDLFCGIGNFTLPLARHAGHVVGVEGDAHLVDRARANATHNHIQNAAFFAADLSISDLSLDRFGAEFGKVVLDPPRTGAQEVVKQLHRLRARRIVYISCNPATLARDAGILAHDLSYRLLSAGVVDMFPHTAHVEAIALFVYK